MTKSKFSVSCIVLLLCKIHLVSGAQFLNATCIVGAALPVMSPLTKM